MPRWLNIGFVKSHQTSSHDHIVPAMSFADLIKHIHLPIHIVQYGEFTFM